MSASKLTPLVPSPPVAGPSTCTPVVGTKRIGSLGCPPAPQSAGGASDVAATRRGATLTTR
eukprot:scaffold20785_cov63-Phaeocystis_antarctica.AAC.3